ncbi:alpha/beta fold hydrolase [Rhodococcus sovatensis]|uniref:Alpha/beta fold hydrolase n=1 Tax=Rhodococcus sovatensis TaxID=1805840 RepID=A0ABZ2PIL6_9NOCA
MQSKGAQLDTAMRIERFRNGKFEFEVSDEGPIDGSIIVLLHGFPQNRHCWDEVRQVLHERGHRTIAFDQRGYAPSARPRSRFAYRVGALASDVSALLNMLGPRSASIVGHDWGAIVAWAVAAAQPDAIRSITTVSVPHPRAFARSLLSSDQGKRAIYMAVFQLPWLPEAWIRRNPNAFRAVLRATGLSTSEVDRVVADVVPNSALTGALNWYRGICLVSPRTIAAVRVPTTHVWSTKDTSLSRSGAELTGRYVHADYRLVILDGTHWIPDEHPDALAVLISERDHSALDR